MKFLCLAYEEEAVLNGLSLDEWQALRQETLDYVAKLKARGQLIDTLPLQSATKAATLRIRDNKLLRTDGPFAETKEQIGGYFLLEAEGFEQALTLAAGWPSARIGTIEVRPIEDGLKLQRRY